MTTLLPTHDALPVGLGADYRPAAGARAGELRAYRQFVRVVERPVPQPAVGPHPPALLVPGFLSGDISLTLLFRALRRQGVRTFRSDIGANVGCTEAMAERLLGRLERVAEDEGRPVALVGHSRGGMVSALAARRRPDLVAGLVTLASPVTGALSVAPHVRAQLELLTRLHGRGLRTVLGADCLAGECAARVVAALDEPFPEHVPFTSVYARNDAILDWRTCLDPAAVHVEVAAGHVGMATDPAVLAVVARSLDALTPAAEVDARVATT